jgi:serine phosphatase RsbU (regulator of sigma subunit)
MATLLAIRGPSAGRDFPLPDECFLGRSLGSDIYIGDLNVSRRHARIHRLENGEHEIEDLGSGNGTFVNDSPITRHRLAPNDVIRIGGSSFRYQAAKKKQWSEDVLTVVADLVQWGKTGGAAPAPGAAAGPAPGGTIEKKASTIMGSTEGVDFAALSGERAVTMLQSMFAISDAVASELDLPRLLDKILDHLFEVFPQADRGFILLVNPATGQLVPEAVKQRSKQSSPGFQFSRTMVNQVMEAQHGVIRGRTLPPSVLPETVPHGLPALAPEGAPQMGAPLICRGESLGTIHLEAKAGSHSFTQDGLALLQAIARQAATAIASARAGQQLLSQQRLEDDLRLAREIQRSFLPQRLAELEGLTFDTYYAAAGHIGGDFYDVIPLSPARVAILIGDVSGHGVSSALLMAKLATDIRIHLCMGQSPAEVLTTASLVADSGQSAMFATVLVIDVDIEAQTLTMANAGHQPPMVISTRFKGLAELEDVTEVALGVIPGKEYPEKVYELHPGDVVLLYTDGINEAVNRHGQDYGMDRLRSVVVSGPADPHALLQRVMTDLRRFVGGAAQNDDQTLVAFGLTPRRAVTRPDPLDFTGPTRLPRS